MLLSVALMVVIIVVVAAIVVVIVVVVVVLSLRKALVPLLEACLRRSLLLDGGLRVNLSKLLIVISNNSLALRILRKLILLSKQINELRSLIF